MIKVLLADDEDLVRSGLRSILTSAGDIEVVAECDDGAHVADLVRLHRPHVVLLDIRMRTTDGIVALNRVMELADPPAVAMLTTFDVDEYVQKALRLGANGFLLKDTEPTQLVNAVRDLARGGAVLDPNVAARVIAAMADGQRAAEPARKLLSSLSGRELEVVALIGQGMSNAEIGNTLHLSEATVKGYVSSVLGKIGAANRVQAALVAYRGGLIG
ncbi:DNA-binding response regulator, NarL/FixJ family, contains REC and HTH domains [Actinokineospora alba]|uniref:DNA-binding response regulator, NarL/FixJ family, contains REC and HTH domains n=1 Tax=Actinokineospora alba TaxID=504798 RepID=A0A1H0S3T7_9PSEU|nr:response regulator transcription factor [Actinokineospora alba]TDP66776.1 LuxR family two component transcriptional regulator [Actinokineospora alba]SDI49921.1 DNA-binding response regulator, NarL/FixJ family, contains REC and HTH domains [Actinokineospora alba]SDP36412.1 DNA-binding response regulator, NarL/FixJ family, contains REC and HTH domains [Actinokineospora alba]